jgi:hypothetical protein
MNGEIYVGVKYLTYDFKENRRGIYCGSDGRFGVFDNLGKKEIAEMALKAE